MTLGVSGDPMAKYVRTKKAAHGMLWQNWSTKRRRAYLDYRNFSYTGWERSVILSLRQGATYLEAKVVADAWKAAKTSTPSKTEAQPVMSAAPAGNSLIDTVIDQVAEGNFAPLVEQQPDPPSLGEDDMIDTDENSGGDTTTTGSVLDDLYETGKKKGTASAKKKASSWIDNAIGNLFGGDDDDRPAWQKYGWSNEGTFASQVAEGNIVTDRARRIILTGYVDAKGTKGWVGKRLVNSRTGRLTNKRGTARELYDARMDAIRKGLIEESAITDPTWEYGVFRDISVRNPQDEPDGGKVTTPIGDGLVLPEQDELFDQFRGMFDDLLAPGKDDAAPGGGIPPSENVGGTVEPKPAGPIGMNSTGVALVAVGALVLVLLLGNR